MFALKISPIHVSLRENTKKTFALIVEIKIVFSNRNQLNMAYITQKFILLFNKKTWKVFTYNQILVDDLIHIIPEFCMLELSW